MQVSHTKAVMQALFGVLLIGFLDWWTGHEVSVAFFYLLPVCWATWIVGWPAGAVLATFAASVWLWIDATSAARYSQWWVPLWNASVRWGFFLLTSYLLYRVCLMARGLELLVSTRTAALEAEVSRRKRLEGELADLHEREQERLGQELHDTLGSYLGGLAFRAKMVGESLAQRNSPAAPAAVQLVNLINCTLTRARQISRLLLPVQQRDDFLLVVRELADELENSFEITCSTHLPKALPHLPINVTEQICRITQEAVCNAVRHSRCDWILITVVTTDHLCLTISNNGQRWDGVEQARLRALSLRIMYHRAERIGAVLSIVAGESGGTRVTLRVPLQPCLDESSDKHDQRPAAAELNDLTAKR